VPVCATVLCLPLRRYLSSRKYTLDSIQGTGCPTKVTAVCTLLVSTLNGFDLLTSVHSTSLPLSCSSTLLLALSTWLLRITKMSIASPIHIDGILYYDTAGFSTYVTFEACIWVNYSDRMGS
jgi:hypothetical protein